jgi:hypothetical protein
MDLVIPVAGAEPKSIEHPFKEPIFIGSSFRITTRRGYNSIFVGRENTVAECIFTIALTQRTGGCKSQTG